MDCGGCAISHLVQFSGLREPEFEELHQPIDNLTFPPESLMYHQGDSGNALYTLRSGLVKLEQNMPDGSHRIVRLLKAGDVAGLEAILGNAYQHNAVVLQEAHACRVPLTVSQQLNRETPRLHKEMMSHWQHALDEADIFLTKLSTGSARTRVAWLLRRLLEPGKDICFLPNRTDLGAILGITTETASRTIAALKREGIIQSVDQDNVRCDLVRLEELAEK